MAKFHLTIEDNADGVSISLDNAAQLDNSRAGQIVSAMLKGARIVDRIPLSGTTRHLGPCTCEICEAMREKLALNPTIH
ncbi:hypothetical protein AB3464_25070 [Pseudomonas asplenii]|uniref:hypothetical protein n=1 Tax=Pseudomonas asplenii TaxID=53407 RepID=UPI0037C8D004